MYVLKIFSDFHTLKLAWASRECSICTTVFGCSENLVNTTLSFFSLFERKSEIKMLKEILLQAICLKSNFTLLDILHSMPLWIRFRHFLVVVWQLYIPRQIQIHFQLIFWHRKRHVLQKELELIQHHTINGLKYTHCFSLFSKNHRKNQVF